MTPEQFAYWMQGFAELNPEMEQPTPAQWQSIKDHLHAVFTKVTPPVRVEGPYTAAEYDRRLIDGLRFDQLQIGTPYGMPVFTC